MATYPCAVPGLPYMYSSMSVCHCVRAPLAPPHLAGDDLSLFRSGMRVRAAYPV